MIEDLEDVDLRETITIMRILQAKEEIREVLAKYCRGLDRRNEALVTDCFHPDAILDFGLYKGNCKEWAAFAIGALNTVFEGNSFYLFGQSLIEIEGDVARCESYCIAPKTMKQEPGTNTWKRRIGCGRYLDRFEKRDGVWRITHRVSTGEWETVFSEPVAQAKTPLLADLAKTVVVGRTDRSDVSYEFGFSE